MGQLADGPDGVIDGHGVEFGFVENFVVLQRKSVSNRCVCKKTSRWLCTSFLRKSSPNETAYHTIAENWRYAGRVSTGMPQFALNDHIII
jgi:hypothetical protein